VEAMKKTWFDKDPGAQNLVKKAKAYDEAFNSLSEVSDKPEKLIALHEENPDAAKIILAKYYDGKDIEAFKRDV
jgi:hypothetical protein